MLAVLIGFVAVMMLGGSALISVPSFIVARAFRAVSPSVAAAIAAIVVLFLIYTVFEVFRNSTGTQQITHKGLQGEQVLWGEILPFLYMVGIAPLIVFRLCSFIFRYLIGHAFGRTQTSDTREDNN